jgi:hypothetical protein
MKEHQLINATYVSDDPKPWITSVKQQLLGSEATNIHLKDSDGWQVRFENLDTAAVATWHRGERIRAVSLVMTGLSDKTDAGAVLRCMRSCGSFCPNTEIKAAASQTNRPAALHFAADEGTFSTALVNTIATAMAWAIFEKAKDAPDRPPLVFGPRLAGNTIFAVESYMPDGNLFSTSHLSWEAMTSDPVGREVTASLLQALRSSRERFDAGVEVKNQRLNLIWQAFGKTAGVAMIYNQASADEPEATLLLLTGLDAADDKAAIAAYERRMASRGITEQWATAFGLIRLAERPLMLRFLNSKTAATGIGENAASCFAAAFFRIQKVV